MRPVSLSFTQPEQEGLRATGDTGEDCPWIRAVGGANTNDHKLMRSTESQQVNERLEMPSNAHLRIAELKA